MTLDHSLTAEIERLLVEKTFSADAVDGIKALRDRAADLERRNAELREMLAERNAEFQSEKRGRERALKELYRGIEQALNEGALQHHEVDRATAVAEATAAAYADALKTVFKPGEVRRSLHLSYEAVYDSTGFQRNVGPLQSSIETETDE